MKNTRLQEEHCEKEKYEDEEEEKEEVYNHFIRTFAGLLMVCHYELQQQLTIILKKNVLVHLFKFL